MKDIIFKKLGTFVGINQGGFYVLAQVFRVTRVGIKFHAKK